MTRRLLHYVVIALVTAVVVDVVVAVRGGDLVLASVAVLAVVCVAGLLLETSTQPRTTWSRVSAEIPSRSAPDPGLTALRRLVADHQSAKRPDDRLQQRLGRLARARRDPSAPPDDLQALLDDLDHPVRLTPAQLSRIIDRIEEL